MFLPKEIWEEIKDNIQMHIYISELDGKHSEVKAEIEAEEMNEKKLSQYQSSESDGDNLFYHVYDYLDSEKYDNSYLLQVQEEVESLSQVESITLTIVVKLQQPFTESVRKKINGIFNFQSEK